MPRRTLAAPAELRGRGLFTAAPATLRILPAAAGEGLRFRRPGAPAIPATLEHLATLPPGVPARCTALASTPPFLTVEHILSALTGLGITDATIELDGPEVPILDGSAAPFAHAILEAGIADLPDLPAPHAAHAKPIILTREVSVERAGARITARPRPPARPGDPPPPGCLYRYELDYGPGAPIPAQSAQWDSAAPGAPAAYAEQIAPARTFCLAAEAEQMRAAGLFTHLSPRDMLVFGDAPPGPIDNTLRFDDEPARHKLLDLIGDLALLARPLVAEITATRSGHALTHDLARAILAAEK